jgi:hypothetical protein
MHAAMPETWSTTAVLDFWLLKSPCIMCLACTSLTHTHSTVHATVLRLLAIHCWAVFIHVICPSLMPCFTSAAAGPSLRCPRLTRWAANSARTRGPRSCPQAWCWRTAAGKVQLACIELQNAVAHHTEEAGIFI